MIWTTFIPAFLASIVEFVEALTIVIAIGISINWKSSLLGAASAAIILALLIAAFGSTLIVFVPIETLRLVVGLILILFGLQWLRKSYYRYSGLKPLHDEAKIYEKKINELQGKRKSLPEDFSGFGFLTSFKSVLLEGLEVVFIVITFGASSDINKAYGIGVATLGALLALVLVTILGCFIRKPLTRIPENTLKFIVGIMLVTFGTFWAGEGLKISWPFNDFFLLVLGTLYLALSGSIIIWLKFRILKLKTKSELVTKPIHNRILRFLWEVFDFFCGDWWVFLGLVITVCIVHFWAVGFVFIVGIFVSFLLSLNHYLMKLSKSNI